MRLVCSVSNLHCHSKVLFSSSFHCNLFDSTMKSFNHPPSPPQTYSQCEMLQMKNMDISIISPIKLFYYMHASCFSIFHFSSEQSIFAFHSGMRNFVMMVWDFKLFSFIISICPLLWTIPNDFNICQIYFSFFFFACHSQNLFGFSVNR